MSSIDLNKELSKADLLFIAGVAYDKARWAERAAFTSRSASEIDRLDEYQSRCRSVADRVSRIVRLMDAEHLKEFRVVADEHKG
ncbi:hypothetical protein H1O16_gp148 [Burkholderia phage BcepSaruman]|uniref:Uncharacterized protein n=1 Tax=Burkholderia phage BcepSaruman TaxID=2530032 RepID=A0A4D5ZCN0_9CAUD|nr:hypothetical protein H1O16_gp148 [Burkholderia phage BcepSaruman]QBX06561.1 hypothetical protein BcepSaruman_148 [Burkholderia phage BcepSaruman]